MSVFRTVVALFALSTAASGGWVVTYHESDSGKTEKLLIQDGKIARHDMIIKQGAVIVMDRKSKSYWQGDVDGICSWMKQMMAGVSMGGQQATKGGGDKITREDLGSTTIAGYQATGYRFLMGGGPLTEISVSSDPKLAGLLQESQQAMGRATQFRACASSPTAQLGIDLNQTKAYREVTDGALIMKEPVGLHVGLSTSGQGNVEFRFSTVVSIEQKDIPASAFEVPAGYQSVADFGTLMERMGAN